MKTLSHFLISIVLLLSSAALLASEAGVVLATTGRVDIHRLTQTLPAARKTALLVGDEIYTGDNARAQLRFADGSTPPTQL